MKNNKIVLLQGENGRILIEKNLKKRGFNVSVIQCYKRVLKILDGEKEGEKWRSYKIDTLIVTSSEILYELKNIFSETDQIQWLFKCKVFVVGTRLSKIAKSLGWKKITILKYANNEYLLKKIKKLFITS